MNSEDWLREERHECDKYAAGRRTFKRLPKEISQEDLERELEFYETESSLNTFGESIKPEESLDHAKKRLRNLITEYEIHFEEPKTLDKKNYILDFFF